MNRIKYINPRTGEEQVHTVKQGGFNSSYSDFAKMDETMHRFGFIRSGLRWRGAAARRRLRFNQAAKDLL